MVLLVILKFVEECSKVECCYKFYNVLISLFILFFYSPLVDPAPFIDGVRINSPHYLCKMVLKEPGSHKFTLVVSQYEKHLTIHYSLRVYATCPFTLQKIKNYCKHKQEVRPFSLFLKYSKNIWSDSHVLFRKSNPELKGRKFDDYLCVDKSSKLLLSDSLFLSF